VRSYHLLESLGRGSFGKVYLAYNVTDSRYYAVKRFHVSELRRQSNAVSQLRRELASLKRISHPNIVKLETVLFDPRGTDVYAVFEFADCRSLDHVSRLPTPYIRNIFRQLLVALGYVHSQDLVHGDIKPSNILLRSDGRALLSDFGAGHRGESAERVIGTGPYQAPEAMVDGAPADPRKEDVWSLGISLYQVVFGALPFEGESIWMAIENARQTKLEFPNDDDPVLNDLLRKMIVVDPRERMGIAEALDHEWFRGDEAIDLTPWKPVALPKLPAGASLLEIDVVDVDDAMSCIGDEVTAEVLLRNLAGADDGSPDSKGFYRAYFDAGKVRSFMLYTQGERTTESQLAILA
jgi:serine/threonine-protein kinase 11